MTVSVSQIDIAASPERAWDALTRPELVKQWQYGSELITDWSVGSPIRFIVTWEGGGFEQWGTVLSFESPREVSYSLFAPRADLEDLPENYFIMTYALSEVDGRTRVTISQDDPRPIVGEQQEESAGENPVLAALRGVAESL